MYISKKYMEESLALGTITGATIGAAKGITKKTNGDEETEERIAHWEEKLRNAKTDKEKDTAKEKIKHWKRENRKRKIESRKDNIKNQTKKGAITGAVVGGALGAAKIHNSMKKLRKK